MWLISRTKNLSNDINTKQKERKIQFYNRLRLPSWLIAVAFVFCLSILASCSRSKATYEKARKWEIQNPKELKQIVGKGSNLTGAVVTRPLERMDFSNSKLGDARKDIIRAGENVLKKKWGSQKISPIRTKYQ